MRNNSDARYMGAGLVLLLLSAAVRIAAYPIVVSDYTFFTAKWFETLAQHPWLSAFQTPFADYAPLYLYLLKLLTYLPLSSLYSIKTLSVLFDIVIAAVTCLLLKRTSARAYTPSQLFFIFALMLCVPTLVINSSLWGQSDALYAAGVLVCFYCILLERPLWAAVALGIALCLKIQAIFFLPILCGYYLRNKKDLWYLLLLPCIFIISILPAWLGGGSFVSLLTTYAHQAGEYPWLDVSSQSLYAFTNGLPLSGALQDLLFWIGIIAAGACAAGVILAIVRPRMRLPTERAVLLSLLCVLALPYFLPRMHERYFYLGDVFSVIYALYVPRAWYIPVLVVLTSFLAYMPFLSPQVSWFSGLVVDLRAPATLLGIVLALLLYQFLSGKPVPRGQYDAGAM